MEPLGTITMFFPFIDDETRDILETTMKKAYNYYDFVKKLTEMVLNTECSDLVVYFTLHHAALLLDFKVINSIAEKYGDCSILLPNLYYASAYQGRNEDLQKVHDASDAVLETDPDDWLAIEMHLIKFEADMRNYPDTMYKTATLKTIQDSIKKNPQYGYLDTTLYDYLSHRATIDGDFEERLLCNGRAIDNAKKFNDQVRLGDLLCKRAQFLIDQDRAQSQELLVQAADLTKSLGIEADFVDILEMISELKAIRGEFNLAIENYLEVVSIRESLGLDNGNISLVLSTIYNIIGEPESGIEWGRMAEDQFKNRPIYQPRAILNQAWSFILLGKMTEALVLIDIIREEILKSGHEAHLAWLHFVTGLLEIANDDLTGAASSIEEALKIYEKRPGTLLIQLIFLRQLAQIEVFHSDMTTAFYPSLALLEEKAIDEDLPGILGQVLLLRAEIALLQNDDSSLREILQNLKLLSENPSLEFLCPHLNRLLKRV